MKHENVIEVNDVTKSFKIYLDKGNTIKEKILFKNRRKYEDRKVLKGVSFTAKRGEAIGLIGHNGCGKSTTLKLLTGIMYPDQGSIKMNGRVSSLIELGAGFHPDMSGRENIYINASILGLTRKEIDKRIDSIIEFSELEQYIDNPVRTYSSGMYMRLAFAVAINVDADILLVDEILAVGDATFQAKCFSKLREIKSKGTTIVIVSHSLSQIEQICDRSIWIDDGKIRMDGNPVEVDYAYLDYMGKRGHSRSSDEKNAEHEEVNELEADSEVKDDVEEQSIKDIEIIEAQLVHADGTQDDRFKVGESVILRIRYKKNINEEVEPILGLKIYRNDDVNAYGTNTQNERIKLKIKESEGWIECCFDKFNLVAATYYVDIAFRTQEMLVYDYKTQILEFDTYYMIYEEGISHLDHYWKYKGEKI